MSLTFFLLVTTFLIITFANFFTFFMHIWTQHVSLNVLPCWFLVSGKPTIGIFNSLLISRGSNEKLRDVLGAYLLRRCKVISCSILV